jgi:hypothetical protein
MGLLENYINAISGGLDTTGRVLGTAVGSLGMMPIAGLSGITNGMIAGATGGDAMGAADATYRRMMNRANLINTPEQAQSLEYIGKPFAPIQMAGEGLGLLGRATGIPYAEPILGTIGETSAFLSAPKFVKEAIPFTKGKLSSERGSIDSKKPLYHQSQSETPINFGASSTHPYYYFSEKPNILEKMIKGGATKDVSPVKQTVKAYVDVKKPLDLTGNLNLPIPDWIKLFESKNIKLPNDVIERMKNAEHQHQGRAAWQMFRNDAGPIRTALIDAGYDGVIWDEWGGKTTVALNPDQIKVISRKVKK